MTTPKPPLDNWVFTFGQCHIAPDQYVRMYNMTFNEARALMCNMVGDKWAFQYNAEDFESRKHLIPGGCLRTLTREYLPGSLRERHDV